jgi:hypothetical protein
MTSFCRITTAETGFQKWAENDIISNGIAVAAGKTEKEKNDE